MTIRHAGGKNPSAVPRPEPSMPQGTEKLYGENLETIVNIAMPVPSYGQSRGDRSVPEGLCFGVLRLPPTRARPAAWI